MARKGRSSPLEGVFKIVSMFTWWVGVVAAIAFYIGLHAYSSQTAIFSYLANVFQYLLPAVCLGAAAWSAWKASHRKSLTRGVTAGSSASSLDGMTWQEFETLVGEAFRQKGYKVQELGGAGPDGGVDLALIKGTERFLVQCKQWKAFKVGVDVVRELYGVMVARGAAGGFIVTCGKFTPDAQEFARGRNVTLIDGDPLFTMLLSAKAGLRKAPATQVAPPCPICGSAMIQRQSKRGPNAGITFWGCTTFPKCKGTTNLFLKTGSKRSGPTLALTVETDTNFSHPA